MAQYFTNFLVLKRMTPVNFLKDMGNFYLSYLIRKTGDSSLAVVRNDVLILLIHLGI